MRLADISTQVEKQINNDSISTLVKQWINFTQDELQVVYDWPFLLTEDFIQTVAVHTTGDVDVTNGSVDVAGNSAAFVAAMVGRRFRAAGDNEWYTIVTVTDADNIVLDRNYEGTTATSTDYSIFQNVYRLHGDVNKSKLLRNLGQQLAFTYASNTEFDMAIPTVTSESTPRVAVSRGRDVSTYTTGTVSGTAAAKVLTGSSTVWTGVEGLTRGIKIRIGNYTYTVDTVDSDTQITIYENIATTIAAGTAHVVLLNNMLLELWPPPETSIGIPYKYHRQLPPLVNDWDESQIPEKYHRLLVWGACKSAFIHTFDEKKYSLAKAEFNEALLLMLKDFRQTMDKVNVLRSDTSVRRTFAPFTIPRNFGSLT